jgi:hypothetical protein
VKSYQGLLSAWEAQAEKEEAEEETEVEEQANQAPEETGPEASTTTSDTSEGAAPPASQSSSKDEDRPSPIVTQREKIAGFMKHHEQLAANHPFATPCGRCRHRLESSPTQDEAVPHCAWAGRLRRVSFKLLEPAEEGAPRVPVCRQFAPDQPWHELIPAHPNPPEIPRAWLKEQILHLVKDANRLDGRRNAFEFLSGRPMGSNENYSDWFAQQLEAQAGELSHAQLFTLFVWAHSEWRRSRQREFSLPVSGNGMQFTSYRERSFPD